MRSEGAREAEIEALYRERFRAFALSATAMLRDSDAALDVVQDAFAIALRRRRSFRG
jgi:DNA-directed RNA polymerase specialized sigma24 family protein